MQMLPIDAPKSGEVFTLRPYQEEAVQKGVEFFGRNSGPNEIIMAPTGCHAKGTGILMYDLTVKSVEDIVVGDVLMGPNGGPRNVVRLCRGREMMYKVSPIKGESFVVNENHMLHLVKTNQRSEGSGRASSASRGGSTDDVTVSEYLSKSKNWKHLRKLSRSNVIGYGFSDSEFEIDPWFLGVILGDGCISKNSVSICTPDQEIVDGVYSTAEAFGCVVRASGKKDNKAKDYYIISNKGKGGNQLLNTLRGMGVMGMLSGDKVIPDKYIQCLPKHRAGILAGLLDTDGYHDGRGGYDYISKSSVMANQVVFIARSLGLSANIKKCRKRCQNNFEGEYHRVSISGNTNNIPCRVARKVAPERRINKDNLRTGFSIEPLEEDDFYGFTLDGDHLYMTSDFIIHHNSGKSLIVSNICERFKERILVLQPSQEILKQNYAKFTANGGHAGIYSASVGRKDMARVTFASIQTVMSRGRDGKYLNAHLFIGYRYIVIDEVHLGSDASGDGQLVTLLEMIEKNTKHKPRILGLTATPFRTYPCTNRDGQRDTVLKMLTRTRPRIFGHISYWTQVKELLEQGFLATPRYFDVRKELSHGFDRSALKVNSTGADYDNDALQKYYDTIDFKQDIVKIVKRINKTGRQVLVFMSSVPDAQWVSENLENSATVTGKTPAHERKQIEADFKAGKLRSVVNCSVWLVGFDYEPLKVVLLARPIRSLSLYYQAFGRALRPWKGQEAWLVDSCGNLGVFGRIEDLVLDHDDKNLPVLKGSNGKLLTGVPLREQEVHIADGDMKVMVAKKPIQAKLIHVPASRGANDEMMRRAQEAAQRAGITI